jgi:Tol biopolymer transport system component
VRRSTVVAVTRGSAARGLGMGLVLTAALWAPSAAAPAGPTTHLMSRPAAGLPASRGDSFAGSMSGDGRIAVFFTRAPLVPGDSNRKSDVYVRDRISGRIHRISVSSAGRQGNGDSEGGAMSADGGFVAFTSGATNLVPGDTNHATDVFLRVRGIGVTVRVTKSTTGGPANGPSLNEAISADGRFVAFTSAAGNLVAGDTNGVEDAFLWDRTTGTIERVSVASGGAQANATTWSVDVSGHGRFVVFSSRASNLVAGDTNRVDDVFLRDRLRGTTTRISLAANGGQLRHLSSDPAIAPDGRFVAFVSGASTIDPRDRNGVADVFVYSLIARRAHLVSLASGRDLSNGPSGGPSISRDGRFVAFASEATNLVAGDTNGAQDVFIRGPLR